MKWTGSQNNSAAYDVNTDSAAADAVSKITGKLLYAVDAGSKIVDVIGSGTDNKGNAYDFDMVDGAAELNMKVGNDSYPAASAANGNPGATSSYSFDNGNYILRYYKNGATAVQTGHEKTDGECFVWEINKAGSNFARVRLTYKVRLTDPQKAAGTLIPSALRKKESEK